MHALTSEAQLAAAMERIRRDAPAFTSSFFAQGDLVREWIRHGALFFVEDSRSLLILRRDRDFFHLYHLAADDEALAAALRGPAAAGTLCADLVGRPEQAAAMAAVYRANGFSDHASLIRMMCLPDDAQPEAGEDPEVVFAAVCDAPVILRFLERQLDRFAEQIPELWEIQAAAELRNILLVRDSDDVGGVLFFETVGLTSVLRYWHVKAGCRDRGIGRRLIRTYFSLCRECRRIILGVIGTNDAAIAKYRHYGFTNEGLVDMILIRRG